MMKTILVFLAHIDRLTECLEAAVYIARQHDSHVIGYYPIPGIELSVVAGPGTEIPVSDGLKRFYQAQMPAVKAQFEDHMGRENITYEWRPDPRFEPSVHKGILQHGREANLIILAHDGTGEKNGRSDISFLANIVLGVGRPVLIVPPSQNSTFKIEKAAIGWNASREACRAAFDSLPLVSSAKNVELLWVNPEKTPGKAGKLPGTELAAALARHDIRVTARGLSHRSKAGHAIIDYARENSVDLLVLGAYGRSRLSEQILGGVTQHVLKNLPCPVLMSH